MAYNPQSLVEKGREEELVEGLKWARVIGMTGTIIRVQHGPYRLRSVGAHAVHHFGWQRGHFTNKSAGVCICLDRRVSPRKCHNQVAFPPRGLAGRGGAVRIKMATIDILVVTIYLAPHLGCPTAEDGNQRFGRIGI